jgi:hypothetical protein
VAFIKLCGPGTYKRRIFQLHLFFVSFASPALHHAELHPEANIWVSDCPSSLRPSSSFEPHASAHQGYHLPVLTYTELPHIFLSSNCLFIIYKMDRRSIITEVDSQQVEKFLRIASISIAVYEWVFLLTCNTISQCSDCVSFVITLHAEWRFYRSQPSILRLRCAYYNV